MKEFFKKVGGWIAAGFKRLGAWAWGLVKKHKVVLIVAGVSFLLGVWAAGSALK